MQKTLTAPFSCLLQDVKNRFFERKNGKEEKETKTLNLVFVTCKSKSKSKN